MMSSLKNQNNFLKTRSVYNKSGIPWEAVDEEDKELL